MNYYTKTFDVDNSDAGIQAELSKGSWIENVNLIGSKCYVTFGEESN